MTQNEPTPIPATLAYRATVRHTSATPTFLAQIEFTVSADAWDETVEAAGDAAFQDFVDMIAASPSFETHDYLPDFPRFSHKHIVVATEVTPTPNPEA